MQHEALGRLEAGRVFLGGVLTDVELFEDGVEAAGDLEWTDANPAWCRACDSHGTVAGLVDAAIGG
jgi:hypothetical protein